MRMNRIIEVDDVNHHAIVEPGVSYFDLYEYVQSKKLKVWIDCPDPGWGSLVGNALDHGVGYTGSRFRNHFDAHCGMEVVLPNGELLRTGMGALPNATTWAQYKMGYGPVIDGLFSQSNFGVVTKMGFWLMPQPEAYLQASVMAPRYEDLDKVVALLSYVENTGLATGMPQIGSPLLGLGEMQEVVDAATKGRSIIPPEHMALVAGTNLGYSKALEKYGIDNRIPYWALHLNFYGPAKVVAAQWEAVRDIASARIAGASFKNKPIVSIPLDDAHKPGVHLQAVGEPNLEFFGVGARSAFLSTPTTGHMWFSPIIPRSADAIMEFNRVFTKALEELKLPLMMGVKPFALPACQNEHTFLMLLGFGLTEDPEMNKSFVRGFEQLIRIGAEHGWGEYRTPAIFQDQVMDVYSFNNHALRRFHETVKDAIDPKGILSAGRYGIWPKHLRKSS
jgi:4-cresol dehydrogenase (hydroxylating)